MVGITGSMTIAQHLTQASDELKKGANPGPVPSGENFSKAVSIQDSTVVKIGDTKPITDYGESLGIKSRFS